MEELLIHLDESADLGLGGIVQLVCRLSRTECCRRRRRYQCGMASMHLASVGLATLPIQLDSVIADSVSADSVIAVVCACTASRSVLLNVALHGRLALDAVRADRAVAAIVADRQLWDARHWQEFLLEFHSREFSSFCS